MTATSTPLRHRPQLLLIDDDENNRRLFRTLFIKQGCRTVLTDLPSGERLLEHLRQQPMMPGSVVILLDINMPSMDGFDVLTVLKSDPQLQSIPVIMFSTSSSDEDISKSYQLGANAYVPKPVSIDEFLECIKNIVGFWVDTVRYPHYVSSGHAEGMSQSANPPTSSADV